MENIIEEDREPVEKPYMKGGVAGCPKKLQDQITNFEMFKAGLVLDGKLNHKTVHGGALLVETQFEIKPAQQAVKDFVIREVYKPAV